MIVMIVSKTSCNYLIVSIADAILQAVLPLWLQGFCLAC